MSTDAGYTAGQVAKALEQASEDQLLAALGARIPAVHQIIEDREKLSLAYLSLRVKELGSETRLQCRAMRSDISRGAESVGEALEGHRQNTQRIDALEARLTKLIGRLEAKFHENGDDSNAR